MRCWATSSISSRATRNSPSLQLGVSPRGATALLATARSWAWLTGRGYVTPDDVKAMARPTLRHRIALRPEAELEGATPDGVLDGILSVGAGAALVVLTGRTGLIALLAVLPIAVSPWPATVFGVLLLVDPAGGSSRLAGLTSPPACGWSRAGDASGPARLSRWTPCCTTQRRIPPVPRGAAGRLAAERRRRAPRPRLDAAPRASRDRRHPADAACAGATSAARR